MPRTPHHTIDGYDLLDVIGEGTAGTVYLARPKTSSSNVAIKIIPSSKVRNAVRREVAIHMQQFHPNILPLHAVTIARASHAPPALALVMSYAPLGDMFGEVAASGGLPPRALRRRLKDIAAALNHLHQQKVVHLDVKLENVIISSSSSAQLIDFGCARVIGDKDTCNVPVGGTLQYIPPELVADASCPPSTTADAWALGVLAYTALSGCYPFNGATSGASDLENDSATRQRILSKPPHRIPSSVDLPSDLHRIIFGLLEKDPSKRMTIPEVIAELERSESSVLARSRIPYRARIKTFDPHTNCPSRPRSPACPADADFSPRVCQEKQSVNTALHVVETVQRGRVRAAKEIRMHKSDVSGIAHDWGNNGSIVTPQFVRKSSVAS